jgi:hypothetical protein
VYFSRVRLLVIVLLLLLDFCVLAVWLLQITASKPVSSDILLPTLLFNVFGAAILWATREE